MADAAPWAAMLTAALALTAAPRAAAGRAAPDEVATSSGAAHARGLASAQPDPLEGGAAAHARGLASAQPDPLEGADMRCAGSHEAARACLLKDLYYDQMAKEFVFFGEVPGMEGETDEAAIDAAFREQLCAPESVIKCL